MNSNNPSNVSQPKLHNPLAKSTKKGGRSNVKYLRFRRRLRKEMFH